MKFGPVKAIVTVLATVLGVCARNFMTGIQSGLSYSEVMEIGLSPLDYVIGALAGIVVGAIMLKVGGTEKE